MANEVKWIKIVVDIFSDDKIMMVESLPDSDTIIVIWFKLLCLAGKSNNGGIFLFHGKIAYTEEMLCAIFRRPLNTIRFALKTFEEYGMIEILDGVITIPNWDKHQNESALSEMREYNRVAKQNEREKRKLLVKGEEKDVNDMSMTSQEIPLILDSPSSSLNSKVLNSESTSTKGKKPKLEPVSFDTVISEFTDNPALIETIQAYIEMRKAIKKETTDRVLHIVFNAIEPFDDEEKIRIINKSIVGRWPGVYPDSNQAKPSYSKPIPNHLKPFPDYSQGEDSKERWAREDREKAEREKGAVK